MSNIISTDTEQQNSVVRLTHLDVSSHKDLSADILRYYHMILTKTYIMSLNTNASKHRYQEIAYEQNTENDTYSMSYFSSVGMYPVEESVYKEITDVNSSKDEILPIAVRYADPKNGVYVIERPPFKIPLDFNFSKKRPFGLNFDQLEIWIPWTVAVVTIPKNTNSMISTTNENNIPKMRLYFRDSPLTSLNDYISRPYTPNVFADSSICFGQSYHWFIEKWTSGEVDLNVSTFYPYMFNAYFQQWNYDIYPYIGSLVYSYLTNNNLLHNIFQNVKSKKLKTVYNKSNYWGSSFGWPIVLYALSKLDYSQTEALVQYILTMNKDRGYRLGGNANRSPYNDSSKKLSEILTKVYEDCSSSNNVYDDYFLHINNPNNSNLSFYSNRWFWTDAVSKTYGYMQYFTATIPVQIYNIPSNRTVMHNIVSDSQVVSITYQRFLSLIYVALRKAIQNLEEKYGREDVVSFISYNSPKWYNDESFDFEKYFNIERFITYSNLIQYTKNCESNSKHESTIIDSLTFFTELQNCYQQQFVNTYPETLKIDYFQLDISSIGDNND